MKEQNTRAPIQIGSIGGVFVTIEYENGEVCLILENRDEKAKSINIPYEQSHKPGEKSLKDFELLNDSQQKVALPKEIEEWEKLYVRVRGEETQISIPDDYLKQCSAEAKLQIKGNPPQPKSESAISQSEQMENSVDIIDKDLKREIETPNVPDQDSVDYQQEVETISISTLEETENSANIKNRGLKREIETPSAPEQSSIDYQLEAQTLVQETRKRMEELAHTYKDGTAIDFVDIENPTPTQNALVILNLIAVTIRKWIGELEQSITTNPDLINALTYGEQAIKERLKAIRGDSIPVPDHLEVKTDINTDAELNEIRHKCDHHVARFEEGLFDYEEQCEIDDLEQYNLFIPQFIKDRLFNGVARFIPFEQPPEHLDRCLQLVGYEVVPIEIGKTQANARMHDIQASRQTSFDTGTIVNVVLPGLRRQVDGEIVQKPVVIRGE